MNNRLLETFVSATIYSVNTASKLNGAVVRRLLIYCYERSFIKRISGNVDIATVVQRE